MAEPLDPYASHDGDVLTLAVGPFASLVNAHYWNATSDFDAKRSTLYHQPQSGRGKPAPRCVVVDWAGGSRIREERALKTGERVVRTPAPADAPADDAAAEAAGRMAAVDEYFAEAREEGGADVGEEPVPSSAAGGMVVHWWKYAVPEWHERSINLIPEQICREHSGQAAFGEGTECFKAHRGFFDAEVLDSVRFFFEGMDHCQGVNLLADANGIFSGIARELLEAVRDDFGKVTTFASALFHHNDDEADDSGVKQKQKVGAFTAEGDQVDFDALRRWEEQGVNRCLAHTAFADAATAYIPIDVNLWCRRAGRSPGWLTAPPAGGLRLSASNPVETGALIGTALSAALSPVGEGSLSLPQLCDALRPLPSMPVSALQVAMPVPMRMGARVDMQSFLNAASFDRFMGLSHGWPCDGGKPILGRDETAVAAQVFVARGVFGVPKANGVAHEQLCSEHWSEVFRTPRTISKVVKPPQLLSSTFPLEMLPAKLNVVGWLDDDAPETYESEDAVPTQLPVAAHLSTSCASALMLHGLSQRLGATDRRRHEAQGLEQDQWMELKERMETLVDDYDQGLLGREDW